MNAESLELKKHRLRWWTLSVLALAVVIATIDKSILNVALPTLQRELEASASELQWMVTAYILVFGGMLLTFGALGDRFGRAWMLRGGLLIFGVASLGAAYVDTAWQLIMVRAVMGIGAAMIVPATLSIAVDVFHGEERTKAIAIWAALAAVGIVLGPIFGGLLLRHFYWGSVFLVNVPIAAVAVIASLFLIPDSRDPGRKHLDMPGAVLSMGAVSLLIYAVIEGPDKGWTSLVVVATFIVAVVLGIAFVMREMRTREPLLELSFFKRRRFSAGAGALSLQALALAGIMFGLTQYLQFVQGYTPLQAGVRFLPLAAGLMIGARGSEVMVRRFGTTRVVSGGLLLMAATLPLMMLWTADSPFWIVGIVFAAIGLGVGNVAAPATDAVMGAIPEEKAGVGSGINSVIRMVGGALGIAVIGSLTYSLYSTRVADAVAALPAEAAEAARNSIGAAVQIASQLPGDAGGALYAAAGEAFTDAIGLVGLVSAGIAFATALMVARYMPKRHEPVREQVQGGGDVTSSAPVPVAVETQTD